MYEFKIDLKGDAVEDVTYRFNFGERDRSGKQIYVVRCIRGAEAVDPNAHGVIVAEGTTDKNVVTPKGLRLWAGKAGDPFWIEPDVLHAVGHAFQDGTTIDLGDWDPSRATNLFAGRTMVALMLSMDGRPLLRRRTFAAFAARPAIFERMLAIHSGAAWLTQIGIGTTLSFGWHLLTDERASR